MKSERYSKVRLADIACTMKNSGSDCIENGKSLRVLGKGTIDLCLELQCAM